MYQQHWRPCYFLFPKRKFFYSRVAGFPLMTLEIVAFACTWWTVALHVKNQQRWNFSLCESCLGEVNSHYFFIMSFNIWFFCVYRTIYTAIIFVKKMCIQMDVHRLARIRNYEWKTKMQNHGNILAASRERENFTIELRALPVQNVATDFFLRWDSQAAPGPVKNATHKCSP